MTINFVTDYDALRAAARRVADQRNTGDGRPSPADIDALLNAVDALLDQNKRLNPDSDEAWVVPGAVRVVDVAAQARDIYGDDFYRELLNGQAEPGLPVANRASGGPA